MNSQTNFTVMNPLAKTVEEGETLINQLLDTSDELQSAIANERGWQTRYKDALEGYEMAETEELAEVIIMAQAKEGPLAGLAVTGEAYKIAMSNLKNNLKRGALAHMWKSVDQTRRNYEAAQVELQQAETRFNALRKVVELKSNILRAATI